MTEGEDAIKRLARVKQIEISSDLPHLKSEAGGVISGIEIAIPLEGLIDPGKERERLEKELGKIEGEIEKLSQRLANPSFVERAQPEVVEQARVRVEDLGTQRETMRRTLENL